MLSLKFVNNSLTVTKITVMSKIYNVPVVAQTTSNTCWHAASLMIWYYWQGVTNKQGPMNTLADNYKNNTAASASQWIVLAQKVGLSKVTPNVSSVTAQTLENLLIKCGPLWCAGTWFGPGHAIVLTGINGERIYLNDPDGGVKKSSTVDWFNKKIFKNVNGNLMYKNPNAY
jgi:ABC-type bacteriocin/lantibiotic exporter with double-glycine peptidase domain